MYLIQAFYILLLSIEMAGKVVSLPLLKRSMTSINISLPCFSLPSFSSDPLSSIFSRLSSHFSKIFQLCLLEYFLPCTLSLYSPFHIRYLLDVSKLWSTSVIRCIIIFFYTAECVFWVDNSGKNFVNQRELYHWDEQTRLQIMHDDNIVKTSSQMQFNS